MASQGGKVMPRVLIVDDSDIFRRSVRAILESRHGCEVCGEADNGEDAVRFAEELRPDAIVMDISLPGINGIEASRTVRSKLPDAKIVVMSLHTSKELVKAIKDAGASAYVLKSSADPDLVDAINAVARKGFYISPAVGWKVAKGA
jgi:DNA-binding NarL/FixJ family response regulator